MKLQWDVFCRVIDNFGDVGVSWRLTCDLADRGQMVRLWLDDTSALRWMAPAGRPAGVEVRPWSASCSAMAGDMPDEMDVGDVVIETFGCALPEAFVARMAARTTPPRWINLEYLSAESYVERSHGLSSPQFSGPGAGLSKQFFYPGFTSKTGGLLREPGLFEAQAQFDATAWLADLGLQRQPGERICSLFAYPQQSLPALLSQLALEPTLLLVCPGRVQDEMLEMTKMASPSLPSGLRWHALPYLSQRDFDHLLWTADLNFVRGEDSFVRAQWAGKPFVWQIYPQADGAHGPKLEAFMNVWLAQAEPVLAQQTRALWRGWNGLPSVGVGVGVGVGAGAGAGADQLGSLLREDWLCSGGATAHALQWRAILAGQPDLTTQLMHCVISEPSKSS